MNQAEKEKIVRAVGKTCRGPAFADPARMRENFDRWAKLVDEDNTDGMLSMIEELRKQAQDIVVPGFIVTVAPNADNVLVDNGDVEVGTVEELERAALPLIRLRGDTLGRGCGYDFNNTILKYPFDGAEHKDECPDCGVVTSWKSPVFTE